MRLGRGRWLGAVLGVLATACSPLRAFNTLVPKDGDVRVVARDAAFGGDPRQRLDVYAPAGRSGPLPVIVFFYGGSWNSGTKNGYAFVGRALAARGFVIYPGKLTSAPSFRIGCIGDVLPTDMARLVGAVAEVTGR